jgi:aspartokinase
VSGDVLVLRFGGSCLSTSPRIWSAGRRVQFQAQTGARVAVVVSLPPHRGNHVLYGQQRLGGDPLPTVARELDRAAAANENLIASVLAAAVASPGTPAVSLRPEEVGIAGCGDFGVGTLICLDARRVGVDLAAG